jgi:hypothetical protein
MEQRGGHPEHDLVEPVVLLRALERRWLEGWVDPGVVVLVSSVVFMQGHRPRPPEVVAGRWIRPAGPVFNT